MNFSHLNFGNNFVHQFSTATKVIGNVQQSIAFIPATSTQHYHSQNHSSSYVHFPSNVQVTTAVIQHQHHFLDTSCRILNQNATTRSVNTTTTSAQTQWTEDVNRFTNVKVGTDPSNIPLQAQGSTRLVRPFQTIYSPSKSVAMHSVSTMTDFENPLNFDSTTNKNKKYIPNEDSDDSSKSSFKISSCSNSCSKIDLKHNGSAMAEYLGRLQPISISSDIQEFLKRHNIKVGSKETETSPNNLKKECEDVLKSKPEIRVSSALDGSVLYCCSECHMAYPHKELLERHLSVHRGERKFECNVCGVCLKRKEHLDQHKRGHSEERPFICEICCKGFKRNEHLRRHIVIHSGNKSHVCTQCGKAFSRKDHLNKHIQTHVGKQVKTEIKDHKPPLVHTLPKHNDKVVQTFSPKQIIN